MNTDEAIYSPGISIIKDKTENQDGLKISGDTVKDAELTTKTDKLWSRNFFLLW